MSYVYLLFTHTHLILLPYSLLTQCFNLGICHLVQILFVFYPYHITAYMKTEYTDLSKLLYVTF